MVPMSPVKVIRARGRKGAGEGFASGITAIMEGSDGTKKRVIVANGHP
jgi:hypothetical protein